MKGNRGYDPEIHFNHGKAWITSEIMEIIELHGTMPLNDIAVGLGRTYGAVSEMIIKLSRQGKLKTSSRRRWTEYEEEVLMEMASKGIKNQAIADELGRTELAIETRYREIMKRDVEDR